MVKDYKLFLCIDTLVSYLDQTLTFNYYLKSAVNLISNKLYVFSEIKRFLNDQTALIECIKQ